MSTDALNTITIPILILGMILSYRGIPQLLIFCDAINDHRRFRRARVVTTWYHWIAVMTSSAQVFKGIEVGLTGDYSNMVGHLAFAMSLLPGVYYTLWPERLRCREIELRVRSSSPGEYIDRD